MFVGHKVRCDRHWKVSKKTAKLDCLMVLGDTTIDHVNDSLSDLLLLFADAVIFWRRLDHCAFFEHTAKLNQTSQISAEIVLKQAGVLVADLVKVK